jgi:glucokinase
MDSAKITGAVDIGGTKIAAGIIDGEGRILAKRECPTLAAEGFDAAMTRVTGMLRECRREAGRALAGIGIGCTGPVDPFTGEIGNVDFLPGWEGRDPVKELAQAFGVTVAMENDADAAALGEAAWGAGAGKATVICVTVGTGIGGGIIIGGKLYRGVDQAHPELGHHVVDPSGPRCFCGADGCWEVLAAGPAMAAWAAAHAPHGYAHLEGLGARELCALAGRGDPLALQAVEREAFYLGLGIANLVTLYTPDMIVLGGSVMRSAHLFLPAISARVARNCGLVPFEKTELALASLGQDAGLIGAGAVWHQRFSGHGG